MAKPAGPKEGPEMSASPANDGASRPPAARVARFTYLDYLELRAWEFEKFRCMPPITGEEIEAIDWKELTERLKD